MSSPDALVNQGIRGFARRTVTAGIYAAIVLVALLLGGALGLAALLSVASVLAVAEFYALTRRDYPLPSEVFGAVAAGTMPVFAALWGPPGLLGAVTILITSALAWHVIFRQARTADTAATVFGAVYVGFSLAHLVLLRSLNSFGSAIADDSLGTKLALVTIVSVWANDVFAYLAGTAAGRHKMAPRVSPHKSWEGFAAGTALTMLVWVFVPPALDPQLSNLTLPLLLVGAAVSIAAVIGDLVESRLKREAGVKDSGTLLPGHGGVLDRIDSLILVSVVAYYLLRFGGAS